MSRNYDNWERLVAAVIKREEDWQLCHQLSIRTSSMCSEASSISDFSSSSSYFQVSDDVMLENNVGYGDDVWPIPKLVSLKGVCITGKMGKGKFGTSFLTEIWRDQVHVSDHEYLAVGTRFVMKKLLGEVRVTEDEFKTVFANCRHENVAAPKAYYFNINGSYIFSDYNSQGSVYDMLKGRRYPRPDWESRVKIAVGAARGIAHIHGQYGGKLAHGNVKSSNIFLNSEQYGCVSDFGFFGIMRAPIYELKNASQESDICSFGVVLLRLLFGESPAIKQQGFWKDIHLRPEDWSSKFFDQSLWSLRLSNYHESKSGGLEIEREIIGQMVEMLEVARKCLNTLPQYRPKMLEVVLMIEKIESYWIIG